MIIRKDKEYYWLVIDRLNSKNTVAFAMEQDAIQYAESKNILWKGMYWDVI